MSWSPAPSRTRMKLPSAASRRCVESCSSLELVRLVMLERLVAFALSQRLFVALGVLLLIGAGVVMLPSLPIDAFPDVSPVQVKVIMKASRLTPEEVEQRITVPIELE